jgi:CubicO group peptidase (beta-lactamase class C family)
MDMSWLVLVLVAATGPTGPAEAWLMPRWERAGPAELGLDRARLEQARDYALTGGGSGQIIRGGKLVLAWGDPDRRYDLKSSTKSIGVTALGLALQDGKLRPEDRARRHYPGLGVPPEDNARTGWLDRITIR